MLLPSKKAGRFSCFFALGGGCGGWEGSAAASLGFVPLGSRGLWGKGREPCGGCRERGVEGVGGSRPCMGTYFFSVICMIQGM